MRSALYRCRVFRAGFGRRRGCRPGRFRSGSRGGARERRGGRAEGRRPEGRRWHGDHGGGGGGRGRRRSRDLSLSLGRVLSGVGPQEAQKAQKLGFSGFCVFCAFCGQGWLEPDLGRRILTQRREGAERRRVGGAERRVTRRAEGGGTEITEAEAAEAGGDVGVPGIFLSPLYRSLSLGRVRAGLGGEGRKRKEKEEG